MEITKATTMGEMLQYDMGIAYVLMEAGMHCVGCPSSIGESGGGLHGTWSERRRGYGKHPGVPERKERV